MAADPLSQLGVGIGLRAPHYSSILETLPKVGWFEAISENYMGLGEIGTGRPLRTLEKVRSHYPVALHGVSLSIGSADPLDLGYLSRLKRLSDRIEPQWISDHLCWTGVAGENLHDLLPLPFTEEALSWVSGRVQRVQDYLGRRISLENVSSYVTFKHSELTEWAFLAEVARRSDCELLLDVNNVYVSSINHRFDAYEFLEGLPVNRVVQMHLAGHSRSGAALIDTHDAPVCDDVWELYRFACKRFPGTPTLIEWDAQIPPLEQLVTEAHKAASFMNRGSL